VINTLKSTNVFNSYRAQEKWDLNGDFPSDIQARSYAQTNIQLFNQLHCNRYYSDTDLESICNAYSFARELFAGLVRGSGKPFMCHLVGTASILASLNAPIQVVTAGLLHASYIYGRFATNEEDRIASTKKEVSLTVGQQTEELIARYTKMKWNKYTIPQIGDRLKHFTDLEKQVLLIRLANELEDHLDRGVLYCGNAEQRRQYICSSLYLSVAMAQQLNYPQLAAALENTFRETLTKQLPEILMGQGRSSTYAQ
jgi:(p)ppGpp synthase/HD superfamily hydrolase